METLWIPAILQTAAVLIWCGRGLWRWYPAWTCYGILSVIQHAGIVMQPVDLQKKAAIWVVFEPLILLGLIDSVLELFLKLSELYRRFRRDRWRWLVIPALLGLLVGVLFVYNRLRTPSDFYRALFLANTVVGSVCASVLLLGWLASIPVRIPLNLRRHLLLLAVYVGSSTIAYANYLQTTNQQLIRNILVFAPTVVMLAWAFQMDPIEEQQTAKTEMEMPESTLEQILGLLKRLS